MWGATPDDWQKFIDLGLTEDLLPVVSNPGYPIAPNSTLKTKGKVPSLLNASDQIVGIGKWTGKRASQKQIEKWRKTPDYGICIQTRNVRALDIDIICDGDSDKIVSSVISILGELPKRARSDSSKCLLAFRMEGEYAKRVLRCEHGDIEFLANGQQFVAAGTHSDGGRYEWSAFEDFPEVSPKQFESLWFMLQEEFGISEATEGRLRNDKALTVIKDDLIYKTLADKGLVLSYGSEGQAFIECPWKDGHSRDSGPTETAYFPAGTRGYEQGHFHCFHSSCSERTDGDFEIALGLRDGDFTDLQELAEQAPVKVPKWQRTKDGRPKALLNNVIRALQNEHVCKYLPRYDIFRDEFIMENRRDNTYRLLHDVDYIKLRSRLEDKHGFLPLSDKLVRDAVHYMAKEHQIDSARAWLDQQKWDGVARVTTFLEAYLGVKSSKYSRAVSDYIWTALAGRVISPGLKVDMVPILQGPQGIMKSSAIEAMAPSVNEFVEISFHESDADLARKMRGKLVGEIPELKGLRSREVEHIKAFITRRQEEWVPKYQEHKTKYPRRTVFFGTTNDSEFLMDTTGNRRWLPFRVSSDIDMESLERDCDQLWAEGAEIFKAEGLRYKDAERLSFDEHEQFMIRDTWIDVIADWLEITELDGMRNADRPFKTLDVLQDALNLDIRRVQRADEMKAANALRTLGYTPKIERVGGRPVRIWKRGTRDEKEPPIA